VNDVRNSRERETLDAGRYHHLTSGNEEKKINFFGKIKVGHDIDLNVYFIVLLPTSIEKHTVQRQARKEYLYKDKKTFAFPPVCCCYLLVVFLASSG
jgi:hypothetical protein